MDLISKATRGEFQEYLVTASLREINRHFGNHDIPLTHIPIDKLPTGERRAQVQQYYASIDWSDRKDISKVLAVYADVLFDLDTTKTSWKEGLRKQWFDKLTKFLHKDGFNYANGKLSITSNGVGFDDLENATDLLDKAHFKEYIDRIKKSVNEDPGLAIGSTKELVEATLKTILKELGTPSGKDDDIPQLLKQVQKALDLVPSEIDDAKKGAEIIKVLLSNLGQVVVKIAELRNLYGTGHGQGRKRKGLNERHAKLAVGAGITLSAFLLETFELKRYNKKK